MRKQIAKDDPRYPHQIALEYAVAHFHALNFEKAWGYYHSRSHMTWPKGRFHHIPEWKGEDIKGKTILLCYEQALGEQILFSQFVPELVALGAKVILECEPRLVPVFQRSFKDTVVVPWQVPWDERVFDADCWCFLGDLGGVLRPNLHSFHKTPVGYLKPNKKRVYEIKQQLKKQFDLKKPLIGLSWFSNAQYYKDAKSIPFELFKPLMDTQQVVSIQYGRHSESIYSVPGLDLTRDLEGVMALESLCTRVLSVSNAQAHLAAASGRPTYVLVPMAYGQHYYWYPRLKNSLFYPTASAGSQHKEGEWDKLVDIVINKC